MSQVYDLGAYRAIVKGVQEFFLKTQVSIHADVYCQHDTSRSVDISCKHDDTRRVDDTLSPTAEEYAMPPKGWKSGREETQVKAVRLPASLIERLTRHVERLQAQLPFVRINEGDAMRMLLELGLDSAEASAHQSLRQQATPTPPQPAQVSLTTQPALPIALEGVPASQAQPVAPAPVVEPQAARKSKTPSAPPGMQHCLNTRLKHPPYASSEKECPMCANNRRQRESYARNKAKQTST